MANIPALNCARTDDHPAHAWEGKPLPNRTPWFWCDPADPLADRRLSQRAAVELADAPGPRCKCGRPTGMGRVIRNAEATDDRDPNECEVCELVRAGTVSELVATGVVRTTQVIKSA